MSSIGQRLRHTCRRADLAWKSAGKKVPQVEPSQAGEQNWRRIAP